MVLYVKTEMIRLLEEIRPKALQESIKDIEHYIYGLQGEAEKIRQRWHKKWNRLLDQVRDERRTQIAAELGKMEENSPESGGGGAVSKKEFDRTAVEEGASKPNEGSSKVCVDMAFLFSN